MGVKIALDNFGTGSMNLNHLRHLPIDHLKIDKSLLQNIQTNRNDEILLKAILEMADNLKLMVTAEGIETQEQLKLFHKSNHLDVQGFYLSKPLTTAEFETLVRNQTSH